MNTTVSLSNNTHVNNVYDINHTQPSVNPTAQAPEISVPSISSAAMLVELSISTWTGRKLDKRASKDVVASNHADAGIATVNKKLLGDSTELSAVQKFTANARNIHYAMTMPWSDTGLRLLPTAQFFKYQEQMTALQQEYEDLVAQFLDSYDWSIAQVHTKLGGLFNPDEYPSRDSLEHKFKFRMNYMPLPEAGDFRVDVGNDAAEQLTTHYQSYYADQLANAMGDVWKRAHTALAKMSERLDYQTDENKKIFRDSLVDNVLDIVELLSVCNVTHDTQMEAMRAKLEDTLRGVTPEALREDSYLRATTKRAVDEAIAALPSLDM